MINMLSREPKGQLETEEERDRKCIEWLTTNINT
jgi:hypothetical protein